MARFLLIRHGHTEAVGHAITGRLPGLHLSEQGRQQAQQLVSRLSEYDIDQIISSPLERACETATPLAEYLKMQVRREADFIEVDFGNWQGRTLAALEHEAGWWQFINHRASTLIPGGETMHQIQARMVTAVLRLQQDNPDQTIAIFSHGDPLKTLVCHFCCIPLDCMLRFDLPPASLSVVDVSDEGSVVRCING